MTARDLLMCVGPLDIDRLFVRSLVSCCKNLPFIREIYLATPDVDGVRNRLSAAGTPPVPIHILCDNDILGELAQELPGWARQQAIKLRADLICTTQQIVSVGADTVVLHPVREEDLCLKGMPILYVGGSGGRKVHLDYERRRIRRLAELLSIEPRRSAQYVDFIMDLFVFDAATLRSLRAYLDCKFGAPGLDRILPRRCDTLERRTMFGEWTLYALFALDVSNMSLPIHSSNGDHLVQLHSQRDLAAFDYRPRVAHFVHKGFDLQQIEQALANLGITDRFQ